MRATAQMDPLHDLIRTGPRLPRSPRPQPLVHLAGYTRKFRLTSLLAVLPTDRLSFLSLSTCSHSLPLCISHQELGCTLYRRQCGQETVRARDGAGKRRCGQEAVRARDGAGKRRCGQEAVRARGGAGKRRCGQAGGWSFGERVVITQVRQGCCPWRTCCFRIASRVKDGCGPSGYQASWDTELFSSTVKL